MLGGFTFKGIHSSVYGVRETPSNKVLSPLKRRNLIEIPGRSSPFIQEDGGYEPRRESIMCSYAKQEGVDLQLQVRKIAGWLNGIGELTFDYEPTMHYNAYLASAPPTVKMLEFAQFSLDFIITHPFAYETAIQQKQFIGTNKTVNVITNGTVETPVKIIIKNVTNKKIISIKITHRYIEDI
jgi:phage-related protein